MGSTPPPPPGRLAHPITTQYWGTACLKKAGGKALRKFNALMAPHFISFFWTKSQKGQKLSV